MRHITALQTSIITALLIIGAVIGAFSLHPETTGGQAAEINVCAVAAQRMFVSQDWTGDALDAACFGSEYAPGTTIALDYGLTLDDYAAAEAAE